MTLLTVSNIRCRYDTIDVISELGFSLEPGTIACLLGPSGCGKTTALRAIAGFEPLLSGSITLEGHELSSPGNTVAPELRNVGMVFQDYALFPHLDVRSNIGFALSHLPAAERRSRVDELLALVKLQSHASMWPHQLSGGQQQRVALARALAPSPRLLLLDEPFSNLDTELRRALSLEVRSILKARNISAILVTHDRTEAFNMADEIGVMEAGRLSQWGTPEALYHHPANAYVANFICDGRFLDVETSSGATVSSPFGELRPSRLPAGTSRCRLLIRPWELIACDSPEPGSAPATVIQSQFMGALSLTTLALADGTRLDSSDEGLTGSHAGDSVYLRLQQPQLLAFPA